MQWRPMAGMGASLRTKLMPVSQLDLRCDLTQLLDGDRADEVLLKPERPAVLIELNVLTASEYRDERGMRAVLSTARGRLTSSRHPPSKPNTQGSRSLSGKAANLGCGNARMIAGSMPARSKSSCSMAVSDTGVSPGSVTNQPARVRRVLQVASRRRSGSRGA